MKNLESGLKIFLSSPQTQEDIYRLWACFHEAYQKGYWWHEVDVREVIKKVVNNHKTMR